MSEQKFSDRLKHAWNAFTSSRDPTALQSMMYGGVSYRPDRTRLTRGHERSVINSVYNRIAIDVAAMEIDHVRVDDQNRYLEDIDSGLHNILTLEANIDQHSRAFIQDIVMSMLDEGIVCCVPIDVSDSGDILTMRTGKIVQWYPEHVRVDIYNDRTGKHQEIIIPKDTGCYYRESAIFSYE